MRSTIVAPLAALAVLIAPTAARAVALAGDVPDGGGCPQPASSSHPIDRVGGADRYETATCAARAAYPLARGGTVVLARGDDAGGWADALAGTVLAEATDAPILLTDPARLPPATAEELRRTLPRRVAVLGGPRAVSETVVAEVRRATPGATIDRIAGSDRFGTAVAVSAEAGAHEHAFVVNGFRPADALVAGAPAARAGAALLLVDGDEVPPVTATALRGMRSATIVGGYGVVPLAVEDQLRAAVGELRRVSGGDRTETAASVARAFPVGGRLHLANGDDRSLVDAIGAGWAAARPGGGAVLYVERDRPGHGADRYLRLGGLGAGVPVRLVGGPDVLSAALVRALEERYDEARAGGRPPQLRAIWAHTFDDTLKSRPSIDAFLDAAAAANLNTVIVEVIRRQDAYYRSSLLPAAPDAPAFDVLARLLDAAHDRGLEVQAWGPVLPACQSTAYTCGDPPPGSVWREHGPGSAADWATRDVQGRPDTDSFALDPGVPEVQDHVVAVFAELVARYDVDAVHLDYLRYPRNCRVDGRVVEACYGYHPVALERFARETGRTDRPAPDDPQWSAWRRGQVTTVAARITESVHAADPSVAVTAAVIAQGDAPAGDDFSTTIAYRATLQDWPTWLAEGAVDAAYPMAYFTEANHRGAHGRWTGFGARLAARTGGAVAVGQGAYLNPVAASLDQLTAALDAASGAVLYSYQQDSSDRPRGALLAAVRSGPFADPAPAPPLP